MTGRGVRMKAHAKLNVFLRVLGRRSDGFHEIQTLVFPLDLHDVVTVEPADSLEIRVEGPRSADLAVSGGESLVRAAAKAWSEATGIEPNVRITIDKRIPVAAGLGGGSADAATTLHGLDQLFDQGLDQDGFLAIAERVGSDVPALVHGGAVLAEGRGERLTPVHAPTSTWVIAPLPFTVRTPDAYSWWDEDGAATGPDPGAMIAALEAGNDDVLGPALFDDLQGPVTARHPDVAAVAQVLAEAGAVGVVMTGSGPTVVALARHLGHGDLIASAVPGAFVTSGPPRTMDEPSGVV